MERVYSLAERGALGDVSQRKVYPTNQACSSLNSSLLVKIKELPLIKLETRVGLGMCE